MKKVSIKNLEGIQTHGAQMEDPTAWITEGVAANWWGLPERWVLHKDELMAEAYDEADVLEEEMRDTLEGVAQKWVKLKAGYTVEIEDITAQVAQEAINAEALAYLASTDWLVIREVDAGVPCPADIKTLRAEARAKVVR
jgi:hypothetical protein